MHITACPFIQQHGAVRLFRQQFFQMQLISLIFRGICQKKEQKLLTLPYLYYSWKKGKTQ